jgi:CBS domain-containing protein
MLEACCTSFQVHVQLDPKTFAPDYNASLLAAAPVLAVAANSPILIGRRLWQETRIALFQHAVDERSHSDIARSHPTRVSFGEAWVENSAVEIYREQIARFRDIMTSDITENSLATLASGGIPQLKALGLHNSTVWRWNRPCFGITEGRPHLRLEFRALPAGPTVLDEVANVALFLGLMKSLPEEYGNVSRRMQFEDAKDNFFAAARHGLKAQLTWVDGKHYATGDLMQRHLIPLAEKGLAAFDIDSEDIERYLGVIRGRLDADQTGSKWSLCAASALSKGASPEGRDRRVVAAMLKRQQSSLPVHQWPAVTNEEIDGLEDIGETVGEIMTTDVFTVKPDDPISLAASLMDWRHIRHLPVEHNGKLVGLVSSRDVSHVLTAPNQSNGDSPGNTIAQIMRGEPLTVSSETPLRTAVKLMLDQHLDCLPVSDGDELIGIVTSKDLLRVLFMILSHSQGRN